MFEDPGRGGGRGGTVERRGVYRDVTLGAGTPTLVPPVLSFDMRRIEDRQSWVPTVLTVFETARFPTISGCRTCRPRTRRSGLFDLDSRGTGVDDIRHSRWAEGTGEGECRRTRDTCRFGTGGTDPVGRDLLLVSPHRYPFV